MASFPPVEQQIHGLIRGIDFGDPQTLADMEKIPRAPSGSRVAAPSTSAAAMIHRRPICTWATPSQCASCASFRNHIGHDVTFLVGTFTGMVGDASDKDSARKQQSLDESVAKAATYAEQVFRLLDRDKTTVKYNHEWLRKLDFADVVQLASHFTVQQFLARDNSQALRQG